MGSVRLRFASATALVLATAACGSHTQAPSTHRDPVTVRLEPGRHTFVLGGSGAGRLRTGDKIVCVLRNGAPAGGGIVPTEGHGVGSSTGFEMMVEGGKVKVTCPAQVGNA
jgi:hypothetical protein